VVVLRPEVDRFYAEELVAKWWFVNVFGSFRSAAVDGHDRRPAHLLRDGSAPASADTPRRRRR
jgi:hypothetical protein